MRRILFTIICSITLYYQSSSQENHFSQFYNSPQYLNPAFAGDAFFMRAGLTTRLMKPLPTKSIVNSLLHFDYKLTDHSSGIGVTFFSHTEVLNHTKIQFNYSHSIRLSKKNWVKAGLGISVNQRSIGTTDLSFPDQYDILGFTGNPSAEPSLSDNSYFPGLTTGFVFYNEISWISFSGDYLNLPKENFAGEKSTYPIKIIAAIGALYPINKNKSSKRRFSKFGGLKPYSSVGPVFCYVQHGKYAEISTGVSAAIQPFYGGIHFRHQHNFNIDTKDYAYKAIVLMVGFRQEEFTIAYSFDASLSNQTVNRNGAHELSFIWYFFSAVEDHKRIANVPLANQLLY